MSNPGAIHEENAVEQEVRRRMRSHAAARSGGQLWDHRDDRAARGLLARLQYGGRLPRAVKRPSRRMAYMAWSFLDTRAKRVQQRA